VTPSVNRSPSKKAPSGGMADFPVIPVGMIKKVSTKSKVETFIDTFAKFNAYQGSLSQKNLYLV